jgi:serine/threonine protein kinase
VDLQDVTLGNVIGTGAVAKVCKAVLNKVPANYNSRLRFAESGVLGSGAITVAVKMLIDPSDEAQRSIFNWFAVQQKTLFRAEFMDEIDFMKRLGHNSHVANMIGCVSNKMQPMLLLEYCGSGDLLHFLRNSRSVNLLFLRLLATYKGIN